MKKHISTIFIAVLFLGGLLVFLYPTISNFYNEKTGSYAVASYNEEVVGTEDNSLSLVLKNAEAYNRELLENGINFVNGNPKDENYKSQLRVGDNDIVGYIEIAKINVSLPIYHGTGEGVLQSGIGHLEGSALPIGGINNHAVLSGHTGLPSAKLLTNLDKLRIGDEIVIKVLKDTLIYKVESINTVLPDNTELLKPKEGKDLVTLLTCTPYGVNTHRLLVTAKRVDNINEDKEVEEDILVNEKTEDKWANKGYILILLLVIVATASVIKMKNKKK